MTKISIMVLAIVVLLATAYLTPSQAQAAVELERLSIEIWPEFDQPSTLVIYRGQLADSVALPALVRFHLPEYLTGMNAVASVDAEMGLVNTPYQVEQNDEAFTLNVTLNSPQFQFEYYDPVILNKAGSNRTLTYDFIMPYRTAGLKVEVQEPPEATEFNISPPAETVVKAGDQLTYHIFEEANVNLGRVVTVAGQYQKEGDRLTIGAVNSMPPGLDMTAVSPTQPAFFSSSTVWLFGLGFVLLTASGLLWFYKANLLLKQPDMIALPACAECGAAVRPNAVFCHRCGNPLAHR